MHDPITLNQIAFQRLLKYLQHIHSPVLSSIQSYHPDDYYFKGIFQIEDGIIITVFNTHNHAPVAQQYLSWDKDLDRSIIADILFHSEQRVADYN